jgi:CheY-like chemotaxis protein
MKSVQPALVAIVDDDESVRDAVGSLFRSMGFQAEPFAGGQEFLGSPKLRAFRCLILDVQMPGMDGLELQQRLAAASFPIPIIFITAYNDEDVRTQGRCAAGCSAIGDRSRSSKLGVDGNLWRHAAHQFDAKLKRSA